MNEEEALEKFRQAMQCFRTRNYSAAIEIWGSLKREGFHLHNLELYLAVARREQARVLQLAENYASGIRFGDGEDVEDVLNPLEKARKLLSKQAYSEAVEVLAEALQNPSEESFDLALTMAQAQLILGHLQESLFYLEMARSQDESSSTLFSTFGAVLRELGRPLEAEREYRRAVDLDDRDASAWFGLAKLYHEQDRLDMTESCLMKVLLLRPGSIHATSILDEIRRRQDQTRTLIDEALEVLGAHPNYPDWHHRIAIYYSYTGEYDKAKHHLQEALRVNPRLTKSRYQLAMLEARRESYQEACEHFLRCAEELGEETDSPAHAVARSLYAAGRHEEAAYEFSVCVVPTENKAGRHIKLGKRLYAESFLPQARRELELAIGMQPSWPDARYVLGRVASEEGKSEEAIREFKKAISLSPRYQAAALALAREELKLGNVAAARELATQYGADPRPDLVPGWQEVTQQLERQGG